MQNRFTKEKTRRHRRLFSRLSHMFWAIALLDALYIAGYVLSFVLCPSFAVSAGMLLSEVPPMIEHIFMSILLLTAMGVAEESVFRSL